MKPLEAAAEDFRRLGVAAIVAGLAGGFLQGSVPGSVATVAGAVGVLMNLVGYWLHRQVEKKQ